MLTDQMSSAECAGAQDLCSINSGDYDVEYGTGGPDPADVLEQLSQVDLTPDARDWLLAQGVPEAMMPWVVECRSGYVMNSYGGLAFKVEPQGGCAVRTCFHLPIITPSGPIDVIRFERDRPDLFQYR